MPTREKCESPVNRLCLNRKLIFAGFETLAFFILTIVFKISAGKILNIKDDVRSFECQKSFLFNATKYSWMFNWWLQDHIFNLLRSKFSTYRDFHTMLYTCAREFDFLGMEMPWKCTQTFLIPTAILALVVLLINTKKKVENPDGDFQADGLTYLDPAVAYNFLQCCAFAVMAVLIMRLKMFFVPQLCILAAMVANKQASFCEFMSWDDK